MGAAGQMVHFQSFTIDSVSRTAITVPVGCQAVTLRNADLTNDATLYDDSSGGNSITLSAGQERTFRSGHPRGVTWRAGDTVVWAQAASGTGPIRAEYLI